MKYTEEELNNIISDYNAGVPMREIEEKYNRNRKSLLKKLHSIGIESRKIYSSKYTISDDDLEFLKQEYPKRNWDAINKRLPNVSKSKIYHLMNDNNIFMDSYFWSDHDKYILIQYYNVLPIDQIQTMLDKEYKAKAIQCQARKLGLTESREWTNEEINTLYQYYENITGSEIQKLIPRKSINAIYIKASQLGLRSGYVHQYYYTDYEKQFIIDHWEVMSDEEIGQVLDKNMNSIMEQRHKLGLYYPKLERAYYDINDYIRHNNQEWRRKSMEHDKYKCVLSGSKDIEVHHKYSFNLILKEAMNDVRWTSKDIKEYTDDELSYLLSIFREYQDKYPLGVCVDKNIHKQFHSIYGNRSNTPEQWDEFVSIYNKKVIKHQ